MNFALGSSNWRERRKPETKQEAIEPEASDDETEAENCRNFSFHSAKFLLKLIWFTRPKNAVQSKSLERETLGGFLIFLLRLVGVLSYIFRLVAALYKSD